MSLASLRSPWGRCRDTRQGPSRRSRADRAALSPADGSTVTLKPDAYVAYSWQESWPDTPAQGISTTSWQLSTDPYFGPGQVVGDDSQICSAQNYACWTTLTPPGA